LFDIATEQQAMPKDGAALSALVDSYATPDRTNENNRPRNVCWTPRGQILIHRAGRYKDWRDQ
jgi:hypothetical protein